MKKAVILLLAMVNCLVVAAQPRAVGGRLGYGLEASYQHSLGDNMVQLEVGTPAFAAIEAACTYDWINPGGHDVPWNERGDWNWYAGVGGAVQLPYQFSGAFIGAAGRIGIEYNFWFPMQISLDWRPTVGIAVANGYTGLGYDLWYGGLGLSIRYLFNK